MTNFRPCGSPVRAGAIYGCLMLSGSLGFGGSPLSHAQEPSVSQDAAVVKQIGPEAAGYEEAILAAQRLSNHPPTAVNEVLGSMRDGSPLAKNWLRMIAADVADNGEFPREVLLQFFADRSQDTDARHAAYQMLVTKDPALKPTLLEGAVDDPSLPVRHAAIAKLLVEAAKQKEADNKDDAVELLRAVVSQGRNPDQLQAAVKSLGELGDTVELADELGLIRRWWVIGTFDNAGSAHFDTAYSPEQVYASQGRLPADWLKDQAVAVEETGTGSPASSHVVASTDSFGVVSINPAMKNAKDAIAYCYVELELEEAVDAIARLGCITASKVWVNGKFVMANEVYHSGTRIDQYVGECKLVPGLNSVLIKICQNAQTESWAQDWQFQFRLTDRVETPVKPASIVQPAQ